MKDIPKSGECQVSEPDRLANVFYALRKLKNPGLIEKSPGPPRKPPIR